MILKIRKTLKELSIPGNPNDGDSGGEISPWRGAENMREKRRRLEIRDRLRGGGERRTCNYRGLIPRWGEGANSIEGEAKK